MYISNNIAERIRLQAKLKNIKINKMLQDVELGENTMSNLKTSMPKVDNLSKIADYLECSLDYLMGRTDNPSLENTLVEKHKELVSLYDNLDDYEQGLVMGYLTRISEEHKNNAAEKGA